MHYEFVPGDGIVIAPGRTLKRIRAVVAIAAFGVTPGQLGGYVESSKNLSGNAWISDNAQIYGNARIYGDAWISDNARIYGDAWISGNARISDNARISGNAQIYGDAQISDNAQIYGDAWISDNGLIFWASKGGTENGTFTAYNTKGNSIEITRGCFRGSIDEFLSKSETEHDDQTHLEYRLLVEVAYSRITRARVSTNTQNVKQ